ncbi:MAG TPA: hypothetical protein VME43_24195 [Bryobacteraceae bacterium]|nr:hypothetical protein [Bryobacteraceae bacterium]
MSARNLQNRLLNRISNGIAASAVQQQRLDFAQFGHTTDAGQLRSRIADLRCRMAQKAHLLARVSVVIDRMEAQAAAA